MDKRDRFTHDKSRMTGKAFWEPFTLVATWLFKRKFWLMSFPVALLVCALIDSAGLHFDAEGWVFGFSVAMVGIWMDKRWSRGL